MIGTIKGQQDLAQRAGMDLPPPAGSGGQREGPVPDDLHEVQDLVALEHAEVDGLVCLLEQLLQGRQRRVAQDTPLPHELTQFEQVEAQAETGGGPREQPFVDHHPGEPVDGWLGYPRPGRQLRQRELGLLIREAVQQRENAFKDGLRSYVTLCRVHPRCSLPSGCDSPPARFCRHRHSPYSDHIRLTTRYRERF